MNEFHFEVLVACQNIDETMKHKKYKYVDFFKD
jgi:hypothetical protein